MWLVLRRNEPSPASQVKGGAPLATCCSTCAAQMSRGAVSGLPLQKGGGSNPKDAPAPRSVQEWLDSKRGDKPAAPPARGGAGSQPLALQGSGPAARRPGQPKDSLDQFISSKGKLQAGPSIFGAGKAGGVVASRSKLSAGDVWPDGMPGRPGSTPSGHSQFFDDGEMEAALPRAQPAQPALAPAGRAVGARAASGGSPFDAGPFAASASQPSFGRRAGGFGMQQQQAGPPGAGFAGKRSVVPGGSTRPW